MTRLLIFIDESGTPHNKEIFFSVGAVWCVPTRKGGFQDALSYTLNKLKELLRGKGLTKIKELHFQDGLAPYSFELINEMHSSALEDETIIKERLPWNGHPIGYRTAIFSPEGESILAGRGPDYYNALRARAIIHTLMPLLTCKKASQIEASIILDAECWKKALNLCSRHIESLLERESVGIDFSCRSSNRVPGLQLADLVAGVTRRSYNDDRLEDVNRLIQERNIYRLR